MSDTKSSIPRYCDKSLHPIPQPLQTVRWKTLSALAGPLMIIQNIISQRGVRMWVQDGWVDYVKLDPEIDWGRDKYLRDIEEVWVLYEAEQSSPSDAAAGSGVYWDYQ